MTRVRAPFTHDHDDAPARAYQPCKCSACGLVATCTPDFDFWTFDEDPAPRPLYCDACFDKRVTRDTNAPILDLTARAMHKGNA